MSLVNGYILPGVVGYQYVTSSFTTNTVGILTKLSSVKIPANTIKVGDVITIESLVTRFNNDSNIANFIYWNDSDDITNSPILIGNAGGFVGDNYRPFLKSIAVISSTSTLHMRSNRTNTTDLGSTDDSQLTLTGGLDPLTTSSLNWTIDSWIILASSNSNPTGWYLRVIK